MTTTNEVELWGEWDWTNGNDESPATETESLAAETNDLTPAPVETQHLRGKMALLGTFLALGGMGLTAGLLGDWGKPSDRALVLGATRIGNCNVSDEAVWTTPTPDRGIDDMILRETSGVTSESGKGAECLHAVAKRVIFWANHDHVTNNDIDPKDPIIQDWAPYAIPTFATTSYSYKGEKIAITK